MGFKLMAVATAEELPVGKTWLSDLLLSGLETLHLRTKSYSESEFKQFIQLIPTSYFPCITIHAHYGLAGRLGLGGIHLTETKKTLADSALFWEACREKRISASFHSLADVEQNRHPYHYGFLSPVFHSISKSDYRSPFTPTQLKAFLRNASATPGPALPLMALGGITENNILQVKEMGFAGAGLYGCLWKADNPVKSFEAICKRIG